MLWLERPPQFESDEQAHDFLELYAMRIERPINEHIVHYMIMVSLYRQKLTDIVWFEGELNEDIDAALWLNPDIPNEDVKELTAFYDGWTRSSLIALCKGVRVPDWVEEQEPPFEHGHIKSNGK
ncbi:hypothetical protein KAR91_24845 [Candidatus Pacearchaeota archaeon]|nr:hypothetical protein [Candidatus Pacearchaeota archaeon]